MVWQMKVRMSMGCVDVALLRMCMETQTTTLIRRRRDRDAAECGDKGVRRPMDSLHITLDMAEWAEVLRLQGWERVLMVHLQAYKRVRQQQQWLVFRYPRRCRLLSCSRHNPRTDPTLINRGNTLRTRILHTRCRHLCRLLLLHNLSLLQFLLNLPLHSNSYCSWCNSNNSSCSNNKHKCRHCNSKCSKCSFNNNNW